VQLSVLRPALQPNLSITDLRTGEGQTEQAKVVLGTDPSGDVSVAASPAQDTDNVTVIVTGLPAGAYLSKGGRNEAGTVFVLRPEDLAGLKLVASGVTPGTYTLQVTAFAADPTGGSSASKSATLEVKIAAAGMDPLVIDLAMDGLTLSGVNSTLDANNDGIADVSGWVTAGDDDAVLFYSETSDPSAPTSAGQLFSEFFPGNTTGTSFGALALMDANADGSIQVTVGGHYPLAEAARAHEDLQGRRTTGSIVLLP
jgi:hypothetical protein